MNSQSDGPLTLIWSATDSHADSAEKLSTGIRLMPNLVRYNDTLLKLTSLCNGSREFGFP